MGLNGVVSGYSTSTNIPRVDGLSKEPREMGASQLGIRAQVYKCLGLGGNGLDHASIVHLMNCYVLYVV